MVRATSSKDPLLGKGVFGVKHSDVKKLLSQQKWVVENLAQNLYRCETYGLGNNREFVDLIIKMVQLDPSSRISPDQIINHDFCKNYN